MTHISLFITRLNGNIQFKGEMFPHKSTLSCNKIAQLTTFLICWERLRQMNILNMKNNILTYSDANFCNFTKESNVIYWYIGSKSSFIYNVRDGEFVLKILPGVIIKHILCSLTMMYVPVNYQNSKTLKKRILYNVYNNISNQGVLVNLKI
jgi:hypothetical protein